jgi:hypothetical protein
MKREKSQNETAYLNDLENGHRDHLKGTTAFTLMVDTCLMLQNSVRL